MKEMLRMILDMDKQACARVQEAEAYRDNRIAELSGKKDEIVREENQKALDFALKKSQKQRSEGESYLEKINERNSHILEEMDSLYNKNAEKWIETIVDNVINN